MERDSQTGEPTGLTRTYDSGDLIERTLIDKRPDLFEDSRSDDNGPAPEHVALGRVAPSPLFEPTDPLVVAAPAGHLYAFVGLEGAHSIMAFRINAPEPRFPGDNTYVEPAGLIAQAVGAPRDDAPEVFAFASGFGPFLSTASLFVPFEGSGNTRAFGLREPGRDLRDTITDGPDVIFAEGGNETIRPRGGDDIFVGGAGDGDLLVGEDGADVLLLGRTADDIFVA